MDVKLSDYGFCNFISGHHATIFYDEVGSILVYKQFENIAVSCISSFQIYKVLRRT